MLTEDDIITDLARLRERSAGIEYGGEIPMTKRSAAATIAPVAALAVAATVGAGVVAGTRGDDGGSSTNRPGTTSASEPLASQGATSAGTEDVKLIDAEITLAGKTIAYQHAVGEDPFAPGWQLAIVFGESLPANATKFTVRDGSDVWVADAPGSDVGNSVFIVRSGPDGNTGDRVYAGMASDFSRDELEDWVRTTLDGQ